VAFLSLFTKKRELSLNEHVNDGLDESAEKCVGVLLTVKPFYGWGWSETSIESGRIKQAPIEVPPPFQVRVTRVWHFQDVRRGFVGKIEEKDSPLNGRWVTLSARHQQSYRITEPGHYNIEIDASEPTENKDGWPIPKDTTNRVCAPGYAEVVGKF
jgi:hypothetical protein